MPNSPLFSVIINCYNSEEFLKETLQSVLLQKNQDYEVIIWDNLSTDETVNIVRSFSDPKIKLYVSEIHTSLGFARNSAISKAKGLYLAFIDSDDLWSNDKLEKVKKVIKKNKKQIIISSNSYLIDSTSKRIGLLHKTKPKTKGNGLMLNYKLSMETLVVPSKIIVEKNIKFGDYSIIEEYDFILKLSRYCPVHYIDLPLSSWRIHEKQLSTKKELDYPKELFHWIEKNKNHYSKVVLTYFKVLVILKYILISRKYNIVIEEKYIKSIILRKFINNIPYSILENLRKILK